MLYNCLLVYLFTRADPSCSMQHVDVQKLILPGSASFIHNLEFLQVLDKALSQQISTSFLCIEGIARKKMDQKLPGRATETPSLPIAHRALALSQTETRPPSIDANGPASPHGAATRAGHRGRRRAARWERRRSLPLGTAPLPLRRTPSALLLTAAHAAPSG